MKFLIKSFFDFIKYLTLKNKDNYIFFYSESVFYREHFIDLIKNCVEKGDDKFIFVTSDYEDYLFHKKILTSFYFKNGFFLFLFFQYLRCRCMILTLTDLGNHLHKSKNCKNFVYFFHSLSSTFTRYTKEALKNYDLMLTIGEYQINELTECEKIFNFPKKKYINTGYFFLDHLKKKANLNKKKSNTILFAPSWNYNDKNVFDDYGCKIIQILLNNNYLVILRPHPEHFKRSKKTLKTIKEAFTKNSNFNLDENPSNLDSLEKSSILLTDNSAIDMEYFLIFKRPVIYLDYKDKIHNPDYKKFSSQNIDVELKKSIGQVVKCEELDKLLDTLDSSLLNNEKISKKIDEFEKKYISNVNFSSEFAANYIRSNFL